jgi:hypothetical protein
MDLLEAITMPFSSAARKVCASGVLSAVIVPISWCQGSQTEESRVRRGYDIEITRTMSNSCDEGGLDLKAGDFIVSQGSQIFKSRVSQPVKGGNRGYWKVQKHLLVVFPVGSARPSQKDLLKSMKSVMAEGWRVKISRPDGSFTPYVANLSTMKEELEVGAGGASAQETGQTAIDAATDELSWFPGRRALIIQQPQQRSQILTSWFYKQASIFTMLYVIDGGVQVEYTGADFGMRGGSAAATFLEKKRLYSKGFYQEVTFANTIKDLIGDTRCDYDIQFWMPVSGQETSEPIQLTLRRTADGQSLRADMYSTRSDGSPQAPTRARTSVPQQLTISQK